ncbi:hypothetical protein K2173_020581 [Erythroxylum novogranatense]|uniref:Uncharacterized protein n=1 Tax=Erythroxylum novogranatense TaxID=1862640 RepID=A0AAV8TJ71_9ROSI|nr:hypothetical protein K2173_020581 [Erythroxylum novogranatense]
MVKKKLKDQNPPLDTSDTTASPLGMDSAPTGAPPNAGSSTASARPKPTAGKPLLSQVLKGSLKPTSGDANPGPSRGVPRKPEQKKPGTSLKTGKGIAIDILTAETYEDDSTSEEEEDVEGDIALGSLDTSDSDTLEGETNADQRVFLKTPSRMAIKILPKVLNQNLLLLAFSATIVF